MTAKLGSAFEHVSLHALQALQLTSIYANKLVKCLLVKKHTEKRKYSPNTTAQEIKITKSFNILSFHVQMNRYG